MESELSRRIHRYRLSRPWDDEVAAILEDLAGELDDRESEAFSAVGNLREEWEDYDDERRREIAELEAMVDKLWARVDELTELYDLMHKAREGAY